MSAIKSIQSVKEGSSMLSKKINMSSLSYLCGYGYGSNSDDDEEYVVKRPKLPAPDLSKVRTIATTEHVVDDPQLHDGRKRSFPHVRGNWASFVYVLFPSSVIFNNLIDKLESVINTLNQSCKRSEDLHVSLSRTFVLKYHCVSPFGTSLQQALEDLKRFQLRFDSISIYCNDECTRTFIALKADRASESHLVNITSNVDKALQEFGLPKFYKDPSFHLSVLWVNGDERDTFESVKEKLSAIVAQEFEELEPVIIEKINLKSGNKYFQYCLK